METPDNIPQSKLPKRRPGRLITYLGLFIIAGAVAIGGRFLMEPDKKAVPTVGGPFSLVNHFGKPVTDANYRGRYMLIYFGYTYCPEVCPTALTMMVDAMERLGKNEEKVMPIFISIDPERDAPDDLKQYVAHFHPRMMGLTGAPDQIEAASKAFKVYAAKIAVEGADKDDYVMDHSSVIFFMGTDGKYLTHFGEGTTPETMAKRMREFL
ncbi:MAG: hypothetical protein A3G18_01445 [Rhodospirillales bacterium RIFCSPLOWO2_12_FULL_58_28]|nr:MAG: hypothetical protein A3H92_04645 [Rhodospirillales bacterium RIFCSPLOWO2_02_FULL_58_16]OHC78063.1 MAG: hypothetical protein A3G18_01445 [Rhodospirillales bacterium RIFCSPLOWO2_12_FULL_58_28]